MPSLSMTIRVTTLEHANELAAAALLPPLVLDLVQRLALGDDHQQPPEIAPIGELGVATVGGSPAEAVERAEGGVLLVGDGPRGDRGAWTVASRISSSM